ncbi:cupredoxin domain-containing protein [uncultured Winogradskyella sp.]|uniref:cupredoxin domain-containing protein n=1 Tax=uncultured Winogradskyella sp. TaxID=395353 RepID=UPI0030DBB946|tara:strand:+ start:52348 stop:52740 length:393 start_codon:yes stop_codon:yes gene_type:complete
MKKIISILVIALTFTLTANAQKNMQQDAMIKDSTATIVSLEQTKGAFTQKTVTLKEGHYIFEIANNNVGHQVGFVLAPKANPEAHIKTAYVTKVVENNTKETSKVTTLKKGTYVYFCPMNPTPQYTLIVE